MEVTFDDLNNEWDWVNTHTGSKFKQINASEYPPLHLYILSKKSALVCYLNDDGVAAGAPEAPDSICQSGGASSQEPERWHGRISGFGERKCGQNSVGVNVDMHKGSSSVRGNVGVNKKEGVSGRIDIGLDF